MTRLAERWKILRQRNWMRPAICLLGWGLLLGAAAAAQPNQAAVSGASPAQTTQTAVKHLIDLLTLDDNWRFQIGDDARWARADFDDANWMTVRLNAPLTGQGVEGYSGYGWYRLHLDATQTAALAADEPLELMAAPNSVGQLTVYIDGVEAGHTPGMVAGRAEYQSLPVVAPLTGGAHVVAVRTWADPTVAIRAGILSKVKLGAPAEIAEQVELTQNRRWNRQAAAPLALGFLFLCVTGLGLALYLAQRHHREYLWMAMLCLTMATKGAEEAAFGLGALSLGVHQLASLWLGYIFMAVTLEFVLRFTDSRFQRTVRAAQAAVLVPAVAAWLPPAVTGTLGVAAELVFCVLVCFLLAEAWRRGKREAGVMLLPFFLAAAADSAATVLDYAAWLGWLPARFHEHDLYLGPVRYNESSLAFLVFLFSLVAVILYRFIRVSQEEQRSSAEIAAARSVQAMLIPTELPSNQHFMLESAYIPVNGVGGDFFQVLPLADESLLMVVGDVSGKGLQAAMNSSSLVGALRNELAHDPATILEHLNRVLLGAGRGGKKDTTPSFATCQCARIYPDGRMVLANAGHLSPYRDGRELEMLPSLPLGVVPEPGYTQKSYQLNRGDRLVFLSDGVVEATDARGEMYGFERTQQVSNEPALYIAQTAKRFGQTDDITVISLYLASAEAPERRVGGV